MQTYRQNDPRWANQTYDGANKYKSYGCFVTSLAMLSDKLPTEVAQILRDNGCFTDGYINNSAKAASLLGLEYHGTSKTKPDYDCIAQTNYYDKPSTSAIETHFIVVLKDGTQIDPLGLKTNYPIENYRLFKAKESELFMTYDLFRQKDQGKVYERLNNYALVGIPNEEFATKYYGSNWGSKVQVVDDLNAVGWIAEDPRPLKEQIAVLNNQITSLKNQPTKVETVTVEKPVEVVKEVEKPLDKEDAQVLSVWHKIINFLKGIK